MYHWKPASILEIMLAVACSASGQQKPKTDTPGPAATPVTAGQELFRAYCASCHGLDGKGSGPAAPALKKRPPDLTALSKRNGGTFPSMRIARVIEGEQVPIAHGSREMPVWGEAFRSVNRDETLAKLKVHNLTAYIEYLQRP